MFWKIRSKDSKYEEGDSACTSYIRMVLPVVVGLCMLECVSTYELKKMREGSSEDIAYAKYQHYFTPSSGETLNNLREGFHCYGVNSYTVRTHAVKGAVPKKSTRVSVPRSCSIVATTDGTRFKFRDRGCRAGLLDYFHMWMPSLMFCTVLVVLWLILLAATSWNLLETLMNKKSCEEKRQT